MDTVIDLLIKLEKKQPAVNQLPVSSIEPV